MPGIVGLITKRPRDWAEPQLQRMVDALRHESFYEAGTWIDESLGVYVGWVARKNSFGDAMPLRNETGDIVLTFSGEEFPEPGTASRLKQNGHGVEPGGPGHLVHLYEENQNFLSGLNGRFHGLLVDRTGATATLFNDRYGMHRLYFHEANDAFYFAAEAKAILAVRPELRAADAQSVGEFISCGSILEDRTLFKNIHSLPSGSAWIFRGGALEQKNRYFQPKQWEQQEPLDSESYYEQLREVFSRNLPRYFNGREQVGMTVTGGMDTRMIMAWRKPARNSLPCYTFGGMFRDCEDVLVARKVAKICEQPHTVISVGDDYLARFPQYAERSMYISEGSVDISRTSDLYVSEQARQIAPVKVVGTYGSEIIRQAVMFKPMEPMPGLFHPEVLKSVRQAAVTFAAIRRAHPTTFAAFLQSPWHHHGVLALEQTHLTVRSPYLDNDFVQTVYRAPKPVAGDIDIRLRLIRDGNSALGSIPSDRGIGGDPGRLFAAASRGLLEFTFKAEYAYDYGMPQWLAQIDHAFSRLHLERLFLGRHKLLHYRLWFSNALSGYVREILLDPRALSRPYVERKALETVVRGHVNGNRNYTSEIHKLISLELVHRLFLDGN